MKPARVSWRALSVIGHLLVGALLTAIYARREGDEYRHSQGIVRWWHTRLCRILHVRVEVQGQAPHDAVLMVGNHISWLDVPVLASISDTNFLSKDDVRAWPLIGWLSASAGTLFIRRGGGQTSAVSTAINQKLDEGRPLTLFPEGTTTDGREVRPFFSRLFAAALDGQRTIVPVALRYHLGDPDEAIDTDAAYTGDQSLAANMLILMSRPRTLVRVTFGDPIVPSADDKRRNIAERARHQIIDLLATGGPDPAAADAEPQAEQRA